MSISSIRNEYPNSVFYLMKRDFTSAFIYSLVELHSKTYTLAFELIPAIEAFAEYIDTFFPTKVEKFIIKDLDFMINENAFCMIPNIHKLNITSPADTSSFIDLGALASNIKFVVLREALTTGEIEP